MVAADVGATLVEGVGLAEGVGIDAGEGDVEAEGEAVLVDEGPVRENFQYRPPLATSATPITIAIHGGRRCWVATSRADVFSVPSWGGCENLPDGSATVGALASWATASGWNTILGSMGISGTPLRVSIDGGG